MEREILEQELDEIAWKIARKHGLNGWAYDLCDEIENAILGLAPIDTLKALKDKAQKSI